LFNFSGMRASKLKPTTIIFQKIRQTLTGFL